MKVIAIVGPTASGKSALALDVAERVGAEIVSADSMQVYRGMDIGTDKATAAMRERVPHHMLDLKEPAEDLTVAEFQQLARAAVEDITRRGKLPLIVGGSGLYFRSIVDDLRFPPSDLDVRAALEAELEELGPRNLHARLSELDPVAASKIEPDNARRTIRALEVIEITGRPFSENDSWESFESIYELSVVGIELPREELFARIESRVEQMLTAGLVEEAQRIGSIGMSRTARQALGYRQILDAPQASTEDLKTSIVRATKRFAKRQGSWFRADPRVDWSEGPEQAAAKLTDIK